MKNFNLKKLLVMAVFVGVAVLGLSSVVNMVSAETSPTKGTLQTNPSNTPTGADGGVGSDIPTNSLFQIVTCDGVQKYLKDADGKYTTTLDPNSKECNYEQLIKMVSRVIQFVLYLLIPIVLGMIVFIGFKYLTANGDSGKLADAKRMITPLLIGIFLIFAAWLIVYTFLDKILVGTNLRDNVLPTSLKK